jgi:translation initiation factor RLI1
MKPRIVVMMGQVKSDFVVGLEKNIWNLKRILLQREVSVVGVQGMGGVGKTTMALALCNDQEIKGNMDFYLHFYLLKSNLFALH